LNFQLQKSLFKSISPTFLNPDLTKQIPLNPAHQDLSNSTKGTLQLLRNFQLQFNLIFSEEIIQYSRTFAPQVQTSWNQPDALLLLKSFPRDQEFDLKHPGLVDLVSRHKTNKLLSFIDRLFIMREEQLFSTKFECNKK
jgi:hypothetical protein